MRPASLATVAFLLLTFSITAAAQFPAPDTYNNPWYTWCAPGPADRTVTLCNPPDGVSFNPLTQNVRLRVRDSHWPVTYMLSVNGKDIFSGPQSLGSLDIVGGLVPLDKSITGPQQVTYKFFDSQGTFYKTFYASYEESPCSMPSTDQTINFCLPADGASVTSPVHIGYSINDQSGSPLYSLIYVDGVRYEIFNTGKNIAQSSQWLQLYPGKHRITIQAHPEGGTFYNKTINVTVTAPTNVCKPDRSTDLGVTICSLHDGDTVSSPVRVQANAGAPVSLIQIYIDGKASFTDRGTDIDTSLSLDPGVHRLTVQAKSNLNVIKKTIYITVQ